MSRLESLLLAYAFNSLWQVPLACGAAALVARTLRQAGPRGQHRAWVGGLLAAGILPAVSMFPIEGVHLSWMFAGKLHQGVPGDVSIQMGGGAAVAGVWLPPILLHGLAAAYGALLGYFAVRFLWRCARVRSLVCESAPLCLSEDQACSCRTWAARLGVESAGIATSPRIFAPVAIGVLRKVILLPGGLGDQLAADDFDMVVAHEFAHIRRNDFLKNLCYELVALPVSYHPLLWLLRQRLIETREMVCDELAAQVSGKPAYVQSLLRLASLLVHGFAHPLPHGVGVFDANTLERRLMKLTGTVPSIGRARRGVLIVLSLVLAAGAGASALAMRLSLDPAAISGVGSTSTTPKSIPPAELVKNVVRKAPPVYPPDAKKARIQGTVVLDAVIGKTGDVENLQVVSGPKELQQSALDAVRQWKYKPFLQGGDPVEVKSTIKVIYSLKK